MKKIGISFFILLFFAVLVPFHASLADSTYRIGDEGEHIRDMKQKLVDMGFVNWNPPSIFYGEITARYVEEFQDYYDLPITGEVDPVTHAKMEDVLNPPYKDGDRGAPVVALKESLVDLGFATWSSPSIFYGPITAEVVSDFQQTYDLPVDGVADQETLDFMDRLIKGEIPYAIGDEGQHVVEMKQMLVDMGFVNWNPPSPHYGSITARYVKEFQEYYDLPVTGFANDTTRQKMADVLSLPFKDGDRGEPVVELKEMLVFLGYASWSSPSKFYGSITAGVVEDFQRDHGLTPTGITDQETFDKIKAIALFNRLGDSGDHVKELKQNLVQLGFAHWDDPNDEYDEETAQFVSEFQEYYELPVTGHADVDTVNKMDQILSLPYQDGDRGLHIVEFKEKLVETGYVNWSAPSMFFGSNTAEVVKDFQSDMGLNVTGVVDEETLNRLDEQYRRYHPGATGDHVIELKQDLITIGVANWDNVSNTYDEETERAVREVQDYYELEVTGIANRETREKIKQVIEPPYRVGDRGLPVIEWKQKLVDIGVVNWNPPSQFYGENTAQRVREFQAYYSIPVTGVIGSRTMNKIEEVLNSPYSIGNRGSHVKEFKEKLVTLGYANWSNPSEVYGEATANVVRNFQEDQDLFVNGIGDSVTLERLNLLAEQSGPIITYSNYDVTFDRAVQFQLPTGRAKYDGAGHINSDEQNIRYFMNPSNAREETSWFLQFMLLDSPTGMSGDELNTRFLKNRGNLAGTGDAFRQASEQYGLNELYLMAHALHETGNGSSTFALGIGVDRNGNIVRDSNDNIIRDKNHSRVYQVVYNMYGYGAFDDNPLEGGVKYAFDRQWFSREEAIIGGAQQITNNYISRGQNTLFKMKWDPEAAGEGRFGRQYATHIMWAEIQARMIFNMVGSEIFESAVHFDVPVYINQPGPDSQRPPAPNQNKPPAEVVKEYPAGTIGETTTNVNFRKGPSTNYDSYGTVTKGTQVIVFGENNGSWLKVQHDGQEGWMHGDFVDVLNLQVVHTSSGSNVNYRSEPVDGQAGSTQGTLSTGRLVALSLDKDSKIVSKNGTLNGTDYNWVRIFVGQEEYWFADAFLTKYD